VLIERTTRSKSSRQVRRQLERPIAPLHGRPFEASHGGWLWPTASGRSAWICLGCPGSKDTPRCFNRQSAGARCGARRRRCMPDGKWSCGGHGLRYAGLTRPIGAWPERRRVSGRERTPRYKRRATLRGASLHRRAYGSGNGAARGGSARSFEAPPLPTYPPGSSGRAVRGNVRRRGMRSFDASRASARTGVAVRRATLVR